MCGITKNIINRAIFDDFSEEGIDLVKAVDALLEHQPVSRAFSYPNTLVLVLG